MQAARELMDKADSRICDEFWEGRDYSDDRIFWRGLYSIMEDMVKVLEVSKFDDSERD